MKFLNKWIHRIGWGWLISAPILLSVALAWEAGGTECRAEVHQPLSTPSIYEPISVCGLLAGDEEALGHTASRAARVSALPVDVATMRLTLISTIAVIFYGLIALLVGYKAFIADDMSGELPEGLTCALDRNRRTGGIEASIGNAGRNAAHVKDVTVTDVSGRIFQVCPGYPLKGGETHRWPVFAPDASFPDELNLLWRLVTPHGISDELEATFIRADNDWTMTRLNYRRQKCEINQAIDTSPPQ